MTHAPHSRISAQEAAQLMAADGYVYLDVRAPEEFSLGHPQGAYNVPLMLLGANGMQPNDAFLAVVQAVFTVDTKLVVGCQAGNRSQRACTQLMAAGYTNVVEQRAGFAGARDAFGRVIEPGWKAAGLAVSTQAETGRSYGELRGLSAR
jgi:rhodanese-related sulfurtransferase